MKYWVGVTDNNWYNTLAQTKPDEVNFWQPSATPPFKNAPAGMPFLFKLKKPYNHIGGGGFFVTYSRLPISLAWEIFGEKNGAASFDEFKGMLGALSNKDAANNEVGCTVLANPFFFSKEEWLADPAGWASNIVRGKMYDDNDPNGASIWATVTQILHPPKITLTTGSAALKVDLNEPAPRYGTPFLAKPRLGQATFRVLVTEAYKRRCALTGENVLVTLEAAHIVPYAEGGTHEIVNGLLLRADFHKLFDVGLIGISPDLKIQVSRKIHEIWFNGKAYYRLHNQPLAVMPDTAAEFPDRDRLEWHFKNRFQA